MLMTQAVCLYFFFLLTVSLLLMMALAALDLRLHQSVQQCMQRKSSYCSFHKLFFFGVYQFLLFACFLIVSPRFVSAQRLIHLDFSLLLHCNQSGTTKCVLDSGGQPARPLFFTTQSIIFDPQSDQSFLLLFQLLS